MNCCIFNSRSIKNKLSELEILLDSKEYDVIGITETWLNSTCPDGLVTSSNYKVISRSDRFGHSQGGGVIMIAKNEIVTDTIDLDYYKNMKSSSDACGVDILFDNKRLSLITVYRPPNANDEDDKALIVMLRNFVASSQIPIVVGDFNLPSVNWATRNAALSGDRLILDACNDLDLFQLVEFPTRGTNILDLILVRDQTLVSECEQHANFGSSDHYMVSFKVNKPFHTTRKRKLRYNYQKINVEKLNNDILMVDWSICELDAAWDKVYDILNAQLNECKYFAFNLSKLPWMSTELANKIKDKNKAWTKWKKSQTEGDLNEYKQLNSFVVKESKVQKRIFEEKLSDNCKTNSKAFFK